MKVSPETLKTVERIADQLERYRGWTARKLLTRGIAAYLRDVQVMRPEDAIQEPAAAEISRSSELTRAEEPEPRTPKIIQSPTRKRDKIDEAIDATFSFTGKPPSEEDRKKIREILVREQDKESE